MEVLGILSDPPPKWFKRLATGITSCNIEAGCFLGEAVVKVLPVQPRPTLSIGFKKLAMVEPLGLKAVAACLQDHDVRIVDLSFERDIDTIIAKFGPDACGIGCSFTVETYETINLARLLKDSPSHPFVFLGGHHASLNWGDFHNWFVVASVVGEGENTAKQLVDALEANRDLAVEFRAAPLTAVVVVG